MKITVWNKDGVALDLDVDEAIVNGVNSEMKARLAERDQRITTLREQIVACKAEIEKRGKTIEDLRAVYGRQSDHISMQVAKIAERDKEIARLTGIAETLNAEASMQRNVTRDLSAKIAERDATIRQMAANECRLKRELRALHDLFDATAPAPLSDEEKQKYLNDMALNG